MRRAFPFLRRTSLLLFSDTLKCKIGQAARAGDRSAPRLSAALVRLPASSLEPGVNCGAGLLEPAPVTMEHPKGVAHLHERVHLEREQRGILGRVDLTGLLRLANPPLD